MSAKIRVTVEDLSGEQESETSEIEDDYILVTAGRVYLDGIQEYPGTGTVVLTLKRAKGDASV